MIKKVSPVTVPADITMVLRTYSTQWDARPLGEKATGLLAAAHGHERPAEHVCFSAPHLSHLSAVQYQHSSASVFQHSPH